MGGSRRRNTSEKLRLPRVICVRVVGVELECDLLGLVGEEQLKVDRRMVMGDEIGEVDDDDESLGASESFLKGRVAEPRMSMTCSSMQSTSSIPQRMALSDDCDDVESSGLVFNIGILFVSISFSTAADSRTFTDSRTIDPWLMLELIGDGGTGAIFDTQWSDKTPVWRPESDTFAVLFARLVSDSRLEHRRW